MRLAEIAFIDDHSFQWQQTTDRLWTATFAVGERQIEIIFTRTSGWGRRQGGWRVDFRRGNYPAERGAVGDTVTILRVIASAIREFLAAMEPEILKMSPTNQGREKLYRAVLRRMLPTTRDYSLNEKWYGTLFGEFELTRQPRSS